MVFIFTYMQLSGLLRGQNNAIWIGLLKLVTGHLHYCDNYYYYFFAQAFTLRS